MSNRSIFVFALLILFAGALAAYFTGIEDGLKVTLFGLIVIGLAIFRRPK